MWRCILAAKEQMSSCALENLARFHYRGGDRDCFYYRDFRCSTVDYCFVLVLKNEVDGPGLEAIVSFKETTKAIKKVLGLAKMHFR